MSFRICPGVSGPEPIAHELRLRGLFSLGFMKVSGRSFIFDDSFGYVDSLVLKPLSEHSALEPYHPPLKGVLADAACRAGERLHITYKGKMNGRSENSNMTPPPSGEAYGSGSSSYWGSGSGSNLHTGEA